MRWFKLNDRTYNLEHIKAFEVNNFKDGRAQLIAIHSFVPERKTEHLCTFDSVGEAEQWIADILKDDLTISSVPSTPPAKIPHVSP